MADDTPHTPIALMDSARAKYALAQSRSRRGPAELALLSLHGCLEDVLRAYALLRGLPEGGAPFLQLLDALLSDGQSPLSVAEAEGIRRMHRLRARVAHGEQIAVTAETIDAYQRLVAKLLPRYGIPVAAPEGPPPDEQPTAITRRTTTMRAERAERPEAPPAGGLARRRGETDRSTYPLLDRYPELDPRRRGQAPPPARRDLFASLALNGPLGRVQRWLIPALIIISVFAIGLAFSTWVQQVSPRRDIPVTLPAGLATSAATPASTAGAVTNAVVGAQPSPEPATSTPTELPAGVIAPGRTVYVKPGTAGGLAMRTEPSTAAQAITWIPPDTPIQVVSGPRTTEGRLWWEVSYDGQQGWSAADFLETR